MSDETMGEVAAKVESQGTWTHVGPDGTTWQLTYGGSVQLLPDEVIYPPRGFCIGFFSRTGGMIGPFATEEEARQALSEARICVVGENFRPNWDVAPS